MDGYDKCIDRLFCQTIMTVRPRMNFHLSDFTNDNYSNSAICKTASTI